MWPIIMVIIENPLIKSKEPMVILLSVTTFLCIENLHSVEGIWFRFMKYIQWKDEKTVHETYPEKDI